ncbi:MAG: LPS assembly lipoprotein LptE [Desulfobacterales bacterium]|jgi:outer membrane lipopolysaccharide assembly protein LptE/RlpB
MLRGQNIVHILLIPLFLFGCGYRFAGSGAYPEGVETIFVEVMENRTSKTGVERIVTNQLIFEFTRQREGSLSSTPETADAVLKGVIVNIRTQTISRVGQEVANEREAVMTLDMKLVKKGGEVVWAVKGLTDREAYDVSGGSKIETDQNEALAIARMSERLSERVFSRLTDDF